MDTPVDNMDIRVNYARPWSDLDIQNLTNLGNAFLQAHRRAPGGISLEIGSRSGGSALLMLELLRDIYSYPRPLLHTVDPYGYKPYAESEMPLYGCARFVQMKQLLAGYPNHVHHYCTSHDFFKHIICADCWYMGRTQKYRPITFAFLDGDHSVTTILEEVQALIPRMSRGGIILIDNCIDIHHFNDCKAGVVQLTDNLTAGNEQVQIQC